MDTSPSMQDSTPAVTPTALVELPALDLGTYRALVAQVQAQHPEEAARIGRAVAVLLTCTIVETTRVGHYLVESCQDRGTFYQASSHSCTCRDAERGHRCKHSWSICILHAAGDLARRELLEARWTLTAKGARAAAR